MCLLNYHVHTEHALTRTQYCLTLQYCGRIYNLTVRCHPADTVMVSLFNLVPLMVSFSCRLSEFYLWLTHYRSKYKSTFLFFITFLWNNVYFQKHYKYIYKYTLSKFKRTGLIPVDTVQTHFRYYLSKQLFENQIIATMTI